MRIRLSSVILPDGGKRGDHFLQADFRDQSERLQSVRCWFKFAVA